MTLFAGLATGLGSIIAFTAKRTNYRFLSVATGFSGGVMGPLFGLVTGMLVMALSLLLMK